MAKISKLVKIIIIYYFIIMRNNENNKQIGGKTTIFTPIMNEDFTNSIILVF